jgi:hypothetical protein
VLRAKQTEVLAELENPAKQMELVRLARLAKLAKLAEQKKVELSRAEGWPSGRRPSWSS